MVYSAELGAGQFADGKWLEAEGLSEDQFKGKFAEWQEAVQEASSVSRSS